MDKKILKHNILPSIRISNWIQYELFLMRAKNSSSFSLIQLIDTLWEFAYFHHTAISIKLFNILTCCVRLSIPLNTSPNDPFPIRSCFVKISSGSTFYLNEQAWRKCHRSKFIKIGKSNKMFAFYWPTASPACLIDYSKNSTIVLFQEHSFVF